MDTPPFSELGLRPELLEAVHSMGFEQPSPIQAMAIPPALEGLDLVGLSQTGSGKTAAFALPVLNAIDVTRRSTQALVICPTRELAVQVCEEIHRLGSRMKGLRAAPVYGGAAYDRQVRHLRDGAHVVVGTPGRLIDHMERGNLRLGEVKTVILDEADRMLDMGFRDEMERILAELPEERQSLFFSATMNRGVDRIISRHATDPKTIEIEQQALTVSTVEQTYYEVRGRSKIEVVSRLLDLDKARLSIIFCNTKRSVDEATEALLARGYTADRLHGDITQNLRERVIQRCRDGAIEILVATDVAARGLDIEEVDTVYNFDLPHDPEDYVHRIGRTGRAGRSGKAVSFIYGRDIHRLGAIERYIRQNIKREKIPTQEQVEGLLADRLFDALRDKLESGEFQNYGDHVDRLLDQGHTPTDIASALFTLWREENSREGEAIVEDREPDRPQRRRDRDRDDRGGRDDRERPPRKSERNRDQAPIRRDAEPGYTRIFLNLGKMVGLTPKGLLGMLYGESNLPPGSIGRIQIFPKHSLVEVQEDFADALLQALSDARYRGKTFRADHDRNT